MKYFLILLRFPSIFHLFSASICFLQSLFSLFFVLLLLQFELLGRKSQTQMFRFCSQMFFLHFLRQCAKHLAIRVKILQEIGLKVESVHVFHIKLVKGLLATTQNQIESTRRSSFQSVSCQNCQTWFQSQNAFCLF